MRKSIKIKTKIIIAFFSLLFLVIVLNRVEEVIDLQNLSKQNIEDFREKAFLDRENELKKIVSIAIQIAEHNSKIYSENEAKEKTLQILKSMTKGEFYYWVNSSKHTMIMHGANDSLNGKNLYDIQDKNGLYLFREIVNAAKSTNEGGLVKYYWEKPGESKPILKYSYMAYFSKWDYIIGTGIYMDDIEKEVISKEAQLQEKLDNLILFSIISSIITLLVTYLIISFLLNKVLKKPLDSLAIYLDEFFKFINNEVKDISILEVNSSDEIHQMISDINSKVKHTKEVILNDQKVLAEIDDVIIKSCNGFYYYQVSSKSNNPNLNNIITSVNLLIKKTQDNLTSINSMLFEFSKGNFDVKFDITGMNGQIASVAENSVSISDNISELVAIIATSAQKLSKYINSLKDDSNKLSIASNTQAASLEETAAALEEISSTIYNNQNAMGQMTNNSLLLQKSVGEGEKLALETTTAMDEINTQVNAINDAIAVI